MSGKLGGRGYSGHTKVPRVASSLDRRRIGIGSVLCSRGFGSVSVGICREESGRVGEGSAGRQLGDGLSGRDGGESWSWVTAGGVGEGSVGKVWGGRLRSVDGSEALSYATARVNVGICRDENGSVGEGSAGKRLEGGLRGRDGDETWTWLMASVGLLGRGSMVARSRLVFLYVG